MTDDEIRANMAYIKKAEIYAKQTAIKIKIARQAVMQALFEKELAIKDNKGTTTFAAEYGIAKLTQALNYTLVNEIDHPEHGTIKLEEAVAYLPEHLRSTVVKYEPKLMMAVYNQLSKDQQQALAPFVTIKPKAPTLSVEGDFSDV